jgi:hypothetical protein
MSRKVKPPDVSKVGPIYLIWYPKAKSYAAYTDNREKLRYQFWFNPAQADRQGMVNAHGSPYDDPRDWDFWVVKMIPVAIMKRHYEQARIPKGSITNGEDDGESKGHTD